MKQFKILNITNILTILINWFEKYRAILVMLILFFSILLSGLSMLAVFSREKVYLRGRTHRELIREKRNRTASSENDGIGGAYLPDTLPTPVSYYVYVVQDGDSIHSIARELCIDETTILKHNDIEIPSRIWSGMELIIPNQDGLKIRLSGQDDLDTIAEKYGIDKQELLRINRASDESALEFVFVPGLHFDSVSKSLMLGEFFRRPTWGRFRSGYGWRRDPFTGLRSFHTGVDISNRKGTYVYAAGPGRVIYTGNMWPFGYTVKIQHASGYVTIYGHLSRILVRNNSWIPAGTVIALMGSTGRSTGPHLHYEVRRYGRTVNPFSVTVF